MREEKQIPNKEKEDIHLMAASISSLASSFGGGREADVSTFLSLAIPDPNSPKTPPIPPPPALYQDNKKKQRVI